MQEKLKKIDKLKTKLKNETNPYKKEQLENKIRILEKKQVWNSKAKGTYRKPKEVK